MRIKHDTHLQPESPDSLSNNNKGPGAVCSHGEPHVSFTESVEVVQLTLLQPSCTRLRACRGRTCVPPDLPPLLQASSTISAIFLLRSSTFACKQTYQLQLRKLDLHFKGKQRACMLQSCMVIKQKHAGLSREACERPLSASNLKGQKFGRNAPCPGGAA